MKATTYDNARKNLRELIQSVCKNAEPMIIISNQPEEQVVLVSLEDFQAMEETAYLLSFPANRRHLERSLREVEEGKVIEFPVEDL